MVAITPGLKMIVDGATWKAGYMTVLGLLKLTTTTSYLAS